MLKFIHFVPSLVVFIAAFLTVESASFTCVHDQLAPLKSTEVRSLTRSVKYYDVVQERNRNASLFEPVRIHFYQDYLHHTLDYNVRYNIDIALLKVTEKVEKLLKVRKRPKPFVLQREGCGQRWQSGPNRGKCSGIQSEVEICSTKDIHYEIPSRYLDSLEVYDYEANRARHTIASGSGLMSANFIVFITSQNSEMCSALDVAAYGTYCRQDPKTIEPLAGIVNLCPQYFARKIYTAKHYYNVILHEMFHILGFSFHLFEKFLPCIKGIYCDFPKVIVQEDESGIARLMFPLVVNKTQEHFNCTKNDFGGPMAVLTGPDNSTSHIIQTSHWHPVLMYSSVMVPVISEHDHLFVDKITLSVFESTGWYMVDYSAADDFKFGEGQGCDFGTGSSCDDNMFLCDPSQNKTGCDIIHEAIGKCTSLTPDHPCGVYMPSSLETCETSTGIQYGLDFYSLGYKHKCFMVEKDDNDVIPSCFPVKCRSRDTYSIMINMTWYPCESEEQLSLSNASVQCPNSLMVCKDSPEPLSYHPCPSTQVFFIAVRLYFGLPKYEDLDKYRSSKNFKVTTLRGIAEKIGIPINYFSSASLSLFQKIYLDFTICPPPDLPWEELNSVIMKVQKFLDGSSFVHILKGAKEMPIASNDIKIDPYDVITFSDHEGFTALLIFPAVCAVFLIATFIASIIRMFLAQLHKPQRSTITSSEEIELDDGTKPS